MIGAAHVSTTDQISAAVRDAFVAHGLSRFEMPETPILPLEPLSAELCGPYDYSRAAAGLED